MADLERALRHAAALAFEEMAFAVPLDGPGEPSGPTVSSQVAFSGPCAGRVVLTVEKAMLPELTANMLGVDEPASLAEQEDALGELTNVLCGNLLPVIAGDQHVFILAAPARASEVGSDLPLARIGLALDTGAILATLYSDSSLLSLQDPRP
jgi:hypothetical protein